MLTCLEFKYVTSKLDPSRTVCSSKPYFVRQFLIGIADHTGGSSHLEDARH